MLISLNWLKDFVDLPRDISPQQLGVDLTLHTVEVEEVIDQAAIYNKMVVGEIKEIQLHANADKLKVCITDIGLDYPAQIICGGENIYEGMKVVVAQPGAKVRWHGEGDLVELKKTKIRGVESQGMICASAEIGLAESTAKQPEGEKGVMDLKDIKAKVGMPLADALGLKDVVIEVDNKSITNRPDLWGHRGMGREVSAVYGSKFKTSVSDYKLDDYSGDSSLRVEIKDNDLCPRYLGLKIDGIKVAESPNWMKQRLLAVGQRPINNLVDISNYVMFELGQPVHIFDAKKIAQEKIIIRTAKLGETITTLDGEERKLDKEMLMIADPEKLIAIAGVMGGGNSEVDDKTSSIIIEAANFEAVNIRQTSQKLSLRSEASARFEKGLDPHLAEEAVKRVAQLVMELIPEAKLASAFIDKGEWEGKNVKIETSLKFIQKRLGVEISSNEAVKILASLGFETSVVEGDMVILVPSWRGDINIPEDIVEEVGRIYGYDKIPSSLPVMNTKGDEQTNVDLALERQVKNYLSLAAGLQETENYVFDYEPVSSKLGIDLNNRVEIANPLAEGQEYLRNSLLPHLIKNVKSNLRFYDEFGLFELGRIFKTETSEEFKKSKDSKEGLPDQPKRLAVVLINKTKNEAEMFYEAKGIIHGLLEKLRLDFSWLTQDKHPWLANGFELGIKVGDKALAEVGLLNSAVAKSQKIDIPVGVIYLDYEHLLELKKPETSFTPLPDQPAITRDIAILVEDGVLYADLEKVIRNSSKLLEKVELFDVYSGEQVGADTRSLAWHLSFRDSNKTLTSQEADQELHKIIKNLESHFDVELRS